MIDSVQSASSSSFEPLFHSASPPKRGRPKGSKAAVVQEVRFLGIHHFAFIRSSFLGLDLRQAFERYLAWGEASSDLRYIQNRRDFILKHIRKCNIESEILIFNDIPNCEFPDIIPIV